jgi:hypothetical protein
MRRLIALLALCAAAQTPGTITIGTTVVATAGSGAGSVSCTFSNPASPTVHTACTSGTATLSQDSTPAVGSTNGAVGSFVNGSNNVTWIIQQPTAGSVTWQIAANGTSKTGTF